MTPAPESQRLVDATGRVRLGIFSQPILEVNHRDFPLTDPFGRPRSRLGRHFAFNQFQFLGALSDELLFGCAIADVKFVATAFVYCYEPRTRRFRERSLRRLLALGTHFTPTPESGTVSFRSGRNRIEMSADTSPRQRRLSAELTGGVAIDAVFSEEEPPLEPMRICTRAGATGWVYARKTAGHRVTGTLTWEEQTYDLGNLGVRGHHDWTAGFMRRHTFWNWGCLAGTLPDGRVAGMNVSCGVNETSFTENCFWVDGRLHRLEPVFFDYDWRDLGQPWRVSSGDGRCRLEFHPEGKHVERVNAGIVATNFHQLFGRYRGSLATLAGDRVRIDGLLGYMESHYAKW
jgi:hypothetical protein